MASPELDAQQMLSAVAAGDIDVLEGAIGLREAGQEWTGLDPRTFALVKIAALIAVDAPRASYVWQISNAVQEGATPEDILGVLRAVAMQVGGPRAVSGAGHIMAALGLVPPDA
jgi:alkylhydroperoxidase/carboxymuconolactone decarboxylase family protein YurZ